MRVLLVALLLLVASPAWAKWVKYGETVKGAAYYYDPATIERKGNRVRVWEIADLKQRLPDGSRSRRALLEHDCQGKRIRFLSVTLHAEPMVRGKIVTSHDAPQRWMDVAAGTAWATLHRIVCR